MSRMLLIGFLASILIGSSSAQEKAAAPTSVTLKGYVVDQMCAKGIAKKSNVMEKAARHTRDCCFHEACAASGFGLFYDGKWAPFDAKGSELARKALEASKREKGMYFVVRGTLDGETLVVSSLKESDPPKE